MEKFTEFLSAILSNMEKLSDEVLLDIFKCLQLPTQLELYGVCSRYANLIDHIWSRKYENFYYTFEFERISTKHLHYFFGSISRHVKRMKLFSMELNELNVLLTYSYPQVRFLRFTFAEEAENSPKNYMQTLVSSFPNIKGFFPQGGICGTFITQMKNLTHLNLCWCNQIDYSAVPTIVNAMKLIWLRLQCTPLDINSSQLSILPDNYIIRNYGGLQSLFLNSNELMYFLFDHTASMSSLRELGICYHNFDNFLFAFRSRLLQERYDEITTIQTKCINFLWNSIFQLYNVRPLRLRKAVIIHDPTALNFDPSPTRYPQLRELVFYKCDMYCNNMVNELMTRAQGVELIRIEYCHTGLHFFPIDVLRIVQGREKPLTLNFYKNTLTDDPDIDVIPALIGEHRLFKLTKNKPVPIKDRYTMLIKFDDVNDNIARNDDDVTPEDIE